MFPDIPPRGLSASQLKRVGRRGFVPASVRSGQIAQNLIKNSAVSVVTFSFNDAITTTITSRSTSSVDPGIRLASVPFMITFFDAAGLSSISPGTNQIPFDTTTGDFDVYGPFAMPDYLVNGKRVITSSGNRFATDGNDLVYKTAIANNSGGPETVTLLLQLRLIQSRGGGA